MKSYTPEQWYEMAKDVYESIVEEIEHISLEYTADSYSKLVVCYEFFRLIRGEFFTKSRPVPMFDYQKELYRMEDDIARRLKPIEKQLDPQDPRTAYDLDLMKKSFSLRYFNPE